jgi:hypothetical protein
MYHLHLQGKKSGGQETSMQQAARHYIPEDSNIQAKCWSL